MWGLCSSRRLPLGFRGSSSGGELYLCAMLFPSQNLAGCSITSQNLSVRRILRVATGDGLTILACIVQSQFGAIFVQKLVIALSLQAR